MIKLFISHSANDKDLAKALLDLITSTIEISPDSIRCTSVPGYTLPIGEHTSTRLREELQAASVVVGLLTKASLSSSYVLFELGSAWGNNTCIRPILGPDTDFSDLSGPLVESNVLKLKDNLSVIQLIEELAKDLEAEKATPVRLASKVTDFLETINRRPKD